MTLPANIAERIDDLTLAQAACTWAEASTFTLRSEKDARAKDAREARQALVSAIDELAAERDAAVAKCAEEEQLAAVSAGQFPRPIHFGENEQRTPARWLRSEIEAWVERCAQGRAS